MLGLLTVVAALWALGAVFGVPARVRGGAVALLWGAVVLAHLVLPPEAGLRVATGGRVEPWLVLGAAVVLVLAYRAGLSRLRAKAHKVTPPAQAEAPASGFSGVELQRYARHLMLREIGGPGQARLKAAKVLVVGAGGLGSPVLMYLAAAGVGRIHLIDPDIVELSNLQRQIAHRDAGLGLPKVVSARAAALAINPHVEIIADQRRFDATTGPALVADADLVLDGTDNFDTRYLVNRLCTEAGTPLIAAAITQWEGQISLYDPKRAAPCFECLFPTRPAEGLAPSCAEAGVVAPLAGVVGSMMAMEAVKALTGAGETLRGRLLIYDGLYAESRVIAAERRAGCACCDA